jgi:hypothetical protein
MRVGVADRFGRGWNRGNTAAGLSPHLVDQARAARAVVLMVVVHRNEMSGGTSAHYMREPLPSLAVKLPA